MKQKVLAILEDILLTKVELDTKLIDSGLVDSISSVDIVIDIEEQFGCKIPTTEIEAVLNTPQTIIDYISQKQ